MGSVRYCAQMKNINNILALRAQNVGQVANGVGYLRSYSKDKDNCCKEVPQTEGRTVEPWPKTPMWPCNYTGEPQPPNYDPYKIKTPEIVVPSLPPSNAKEVPCEDMQHRERISSSNTLGFNMPSAAVQDLFHKSHIVHPDNWKHKSLDRSLRLNNDVGQEVIPRLGYHGKSKYKYAFHEPWNPLDRLSLLAQAEKNECPSLESKELEEDSLPTNTSKEQRI